MILFLALILTVSSSVAVRQCNTCDGSCTSQSPAPCGGGDVMCITASLIVNQTSSGTSMRQIIKKCTTFSVCPELGSNMYEADFGYSSVLVSARCCNTDNCNQETLSFPATQTSTSSLQCLACNSTTSSVCNETLQCQGNENNCLGATVGDSATPLFGCVSSNVCTVLELLSTSLGFQGTLSSGCCATALCNRGIPTTIAPNTTTPEMVTEPTGLTTRGGSSCVSLSVLHLLLGLALFTAF